MCRSKEHGGRRCPGGVGRSLKRQAERIALDALRPGAPDWQRDEAVGGTAEFLAAALTAARRLEAAGAIPDAREMVRNAYTAYRHTYRPAVQVWRPLDVPVTPTGADWDRDGWTVRFGDIAVPTGAHDRFGAAARAERALKEQLGYAGKVTIPIDAPDGWTGDDPEHIARVNAGMRWRHLAEAVTTRGIRTVGLDRDDYIRRRVAGEPVTVTVAASSIRPAARGAFS